MRVAGAKVRLQANRAATPAVVAAAWRGRAVTRAEEPPR